MLLLSMRRGAARRRATEVGLRMLRAIFAQINAPVVLVSHAAILEHITLALPHDP